MEGCGGRLGRLSARADLSQEVVWGESPSTCVGCVVSYVCEGRERRVEMVNVCGKRDGEGRGEEEEEVRGREDS